MQRRDHGGLPRSELVRRYTLPTLFGIAMAAIAYAVSLPLLFWMAPVIAGLFSVHSDGTPVVRDFSRIQIVDHPEQTAPPDVFFRANELADGSDHVVVPPLIELGDDHELLEDHWRICPTTNSAFAVRSIHISPSRARWRDLRGGPELSHDARGNGSS